MRVAVSAGSGRPFHLGVERRGPTGAPPVVLLHGLADDRSLWRHIAPRLAARHDVVAVDLPGHGESDPVPDGAPIDWFAEVVRGLLGELRLTDVVLAGLSMGGGVAQYVATHPDPPRLRGLVLVSTSPVFPDATKRRFHERAEMAEAGGMAAVVDATVPRWFTPAFLASRPEEVAATRATVLRTDPTSFARASRANAARDCTDRLASIRCPVLFVAGTDDPAEPERAAALYRHRIADLQIDLIEGASHLLPVEAPDRFVELVSGFLDRLPAPVESPATHAPTGVPA